MLSASSVGVHHDDGVRRARTFNISECGRSFAQRSPIVRLGTDLTPTHGVEVATRRSKMRVERLKSDAFEHRVKLVCAASAHFRLLLPTQTQVEGEKHLGGIGADAALLLRPGRDEVVLIEAPLDLVLVSLDGPALEDVVSSGGAHLDLEALGNGRAEQDLILAKMASAIRLGLSISPCEPFFAQLVFAAVLRMATLSGAAMSGPRQGGLAPWQERRAKALIGEDLGKTRSILEVARACNLSLTYFSKAFKISTGVTPHEWLQAERISQARRLLKVDIPLAEVAAACGFADQSHFSKIFKRETGFSPSIWRRLNTKLDPVRAATNER